MAHNPNFALLVILSHGFLIMVLLNVVVVGIQIHFNEDFYPKV